MSRLWQSYLSVLHRRPWSTQMVQTGVLMAAGDVVAQIILPEKDAKGAIDKTRVARFAFLGLFFVGPTVRAWYLTMERMVKPLRLSHAPSSLAKVALDQIFFAPTINASLLGLVGLTQGLDLGQVKKKLDDQFLDVIITNWKIWPLVQTVNFTMVPFLLRPLAVSVAALFWNTYLSFKSNASVSNQSHVQINNDHSDQVRDNRQISAERVAEANLKLN